jgi:hypothetical protein
MRRGFRPRPLVALTSRFFRIRVDLCSSVVHLPKQERPGQQVWGVGVHPFVG